MRRSFLVLMLLPALAVAQTTTTAPLRIRLVSDPTLDTFTFRDDACASTISVQWIYTPGTVGNICSNLKLWATEGQCGDNPGADDKRYTEVAISDILLKRTDQFSVKIAELPGFTATTLSDGGTNVSVVCGAQNVTKSHQICGSTTTSLQQCGFTTPVVLSAAALTFTYDTKPPTPPTITAKSEDGSAKVTFTATDSDTSQVFAEYRLSVDAGDDPSDGGVAFGQSTSPVLVTAGSIKVPNLANGSAYDIRVRALDAAGNQSLPSEVATVVPVRAIGFFGVLRNDGSTEQGGCAVAGSMLMLPLAGLALARALARKSRR